MNYIKEINAFYDKVERNPLSASAVTLWHTLMHINNKARWVKSFTVAAPVIRLKSGLTDSSFKRARTELKEKGYIDFQSRSRNQTPIYQMVKLAVEYDISDADDMAAAREIHTFPQAADVIESKATAHSKDVPSSQHPDPHNAHTSNQATGRSMDEGMNHLTDQHMSPLIKQKENKNKKDNTTTADSTIAFFQENFGAASPYVSRELVRWVSHSGEELVLHAMKRALERGKTNWGYVRAILESWREKGIDSVEEARIEELSFKSKSASRKGWGSYGGGIGREEVVPAWFWERKKAVQKGAKQPVVAHDMQKESQEIKRMLVELG